MRSIVFCNVLRCPFDTARFLVYTRAAILKLHVIHIYVLKDADYNRLHCQL